MHQRHRRARPRRQRAAGRDCGPRAARRVGRRGWRCSARRHAVQASRRHRRSAPRRDRSAPAPGWTCRCPAALRSARARPPMRDAGGLMHRRHRAFIRQAGRSSTRQAPGCAIAPVVRGQRAVMRLGDGAGDGEAEAGVAAEILARRAQRMEPLEHLFARFGRDAGAVIADSQRRRDRRRAMMVDRDLPPRRARTTRHCRAGCRSTRSSRAASPGTTRARHRCAAGRSGNRR